MIYKNIEIHNTCELIECEGGGVTWYRMPKKAYDAAETDASRKALRNSTGVELRFIMNSPEVTIKLQSVTGDAINCSYQVFFGGIQGGWEAHECMRPVIGSDVVDCVIKKPNLEGLKRVAKASNISFDPEVVRVIFNRGHIKVIDVIGDVEPPSKELLPEKTLLCYGSSITHGSNALSMPNSWSYLLAHRFDMDILNLGMAGTCRMEPEIIDHIASLGEQGRWDVATLELGINVLDWENEKIYDRVTNTIRQVASRNPEKLIFVISPFYCNGDFVGGDKANNWRRIIKEICERENFPNVTYVCGTDVLGDISLISADMVHPNIYGVNQIAERLGNVMAEKI
jgi:hypothetical protein